VRANIGGLQFADDGAINQNGAYALIATGALQPAAGKDPSGNDYPGLNCSGFAKWLIDGILEPETGKLLTIADLKKPFGTRGSPFSAPYESLDPFFGLDWTRNLASIANSTLIAPQFGKIEEFEVRSAPFSSLLPENGDGELAENWPGWLKDVGFNVEGLKPLLYTLAIDHPDRFYLAAVSSESYAPTTPTNPRGLPMLRRYFHVTALVPYFNEHGNFRVVVFESAAETNFTAFQKRYETKKYLDAAVNLVSIPLSGSFIAP
jgi:hypothetical protein